MSSEREPIEHELIRTAVAAEFEVIEAKIQPTPGGDDTHARVTLRMDEADVEVFSIALIYVLGALSFHDGRPRGVSGEWFEDDDQWTAGDMLRHFEFRRGRLSFYADYVRGRCLKTAIEVDRDGTVLVETVNRGEAVLRWIDQLRGKKYLQPVA